MNPRHILSLNGLARVRVRATFAKDLLLALHKAYQRHLAGKQPQGSTTDKIIGLTKKVDKLFETEKSEEMLEEIRRWKAHASMTGKNKGRRESMDENRREADEF